MSSRPPTTTPTAGHGLDARVEQLGRWTAKRTTRRSFLHRLSQIAVLVAAGPIMANLLIRKAQARVCGQSGITPKCDTFDCTGEGSVWGWCWYASDGCCRDGGLKKICDCCILDYPNVHGYCPVGTNVACIVESCGKDPRVLTVDLVPVEWDAQDGYFPAAAVAANTTSGKVVLVDDDNPVLTYLAAPVAGALGIPIFPLGPSGPSPKVTRAIQQLEPREALIVGGISSSARASIQRLGLRLRDIAGGSDPAAISNDVANFLVRVSNVNRTVTVASTGLSAEVTPLAAVFAAVAGFPLLLDSQTTATIGLPTLYIGAEPDDAGVPSERTGSTNLTDLAVELAGLASALAYVDAGRISIVPAGSSDIIGMVNTGAPVLLHPQASLGPIEGWIDTHTLQFGELREVFYIKGPGELTIDQYWALQGAANGFRTDQLMGVAGQGLPVIRQPYAERPIGLARIGSAPQPGSVGAPDYWTSIGQTFRG